MESFIDIIIFGAAVLWTVVVAVKKSKEAANAPQPKRPVFVDENIEMPEEEYKTEEKEETFSESKPFSYETMSERDFEKEFSKNFEYSENQNIHTEKDSSNKSLTFEEDEVLKGIVYSEILKKKY